MSNLNEKFKKNKKKVTIMLSILLIAGIGIYFFIKQNTQKHIGEQQLLDKNYRLADGIVTGNDIGFIRLLSAKDGKELSSIDLKKNTDSRYMYSKNKDLDKVYVYGTLENAFYEITINKSTLESKKIVQPEKEIDFETFKAEGDYVVTLSKDKRVLNKVNKDGNLKNYTLDEEINDYIITDDMLVFTTSDHIHRINLINDDIFKIEIGDKTTGLFSVKEGVIAFNKFGSGLKQSIALKINPKDLNIQNMQKIDSPNIIPITPDSDDERLAYIEEINIDTNSRQTMTILKEENLNKETSNIKLPSIDKDFKYSNEVSIASKGYMYTHNKNKLEIVDIRSGQLRNSIEVGEIFVTPIIK